MCRPAASLKATKCACSQLTHTSALGFAQLCGRVCVCVKDSLVDEDVKRVRWIGSVGGWFGGKWVALGQVQCLGFAQFTRAHTHTRV